jgi:hypothetical protein
MLDIMLEKNMRFLTQTEVTTKAKLGNKKKKETI